MGSIFFRLVLGQDFLSFGVETGFFLFGARAGFFAVWCWGRIFLRSVLGLDFFTSGVGAGFFSVGVRASFFPVQCWDRYWKSIVSVPHLLRFKQKYCFKRICNEKPVLLSPKILVNLFSVSLIMLQAAKELLRLLVNPYIFLCRSNYVCITKE